MIWRPMLLLMIGLLALGRPALAEPFETAARQAFLVDLSTGTVLFQKNADERMPTSSMSKIMTAYMVFMALRDGRLHMDDLLLVSEYAWGKGGSSMFLNVNSRVAVADLIQGMIVQSGNDASIVLAEGLAGSEAAFADQMNRQAEALGLNDSHFANSTGWPDPNHYSTARDLAVVAAAVLRDFPEHYHFYSQREFTWNEIRQPNRNPLLGRSPGVDGMKTGHTSDAGYGLVASAIRDGRRLLMVINGLDSERARAEESERLLEWGYREFESFRAFETGEVVDTARVWMGESDQVSLVAPADIWITVRRAEREQLRVAVRYNEPLPSPIMAGQEVATLAISAPELPERSVPLVAGSAVGKRGFFGRLVGGAGYYILGNG